MSASDPKRTSLFALQMSAFGAKRTRRFALHMSANDPKRTCLMHAGSANFCRQKRGELFFWMSSMPGMINKSALRIALACAALFAAAGQAAASEDIAGLVDIGGGRKMYLECRGAGSPTVVLVAGLRASAEDWNIAKGSGPTVFTEVAKLTRVCADRPARNAGR